MGWKQWALFRFTNDTTGDTLKLNFPDTSAHQGWPFAATKDTEKRDRISYETIAAHDITPKTTYAYGQTGQPHTWTGMEGTVEIWTRSAEGGLADKIATVFYSSPFMVHPPNRFEINSVATGWSVQQRGAMYHGDGLGTINVKVRRV